MSDPHTYITRTLEVSGPINAQNMVVSYVNATEMVGTVQINVASANIATALAEPRSINGVSFDGTGNITVTANTPQTLTRGSYLTGSNFNGSGATTWAVDATSTNTASKVVVRDASGNFSAGTITASLSGNASTATKFATARTINGVSFDGTGNITVTANTPQTLTRGSYLTGSNFNGSGATTWAVDATSTNTASKVVVRDASGNFSAGTITASLDGNAATATKWATARTFSLTGDVTGSVSIDGSGNASLSTTVANDSHDHSASNITSGTLVVARGGTGTTTSTGTGSVVLSASPTLTGTVSASNLTLSGNLIVNGTTTTVDSSVVTIEDPVFRLGIDSTIADSKDRGIEFVYGDGTSAKIGFFGWDRSSDRFKLLTDATNTGETFTGTLGDIEATTFYGSLSGNATTVTNGVYTSRTITAGDGLTGGGDLSANRTLSHADTSTQASVNNSNGTVIQDITLDTYGHVTAIGSYDLDGRYYTESEADSRFVNVTGDTMTGNLTVSGKVLADRITTLEFSGPRQSYVYIGSYDYSSALEVYVRENPGDASYTSGSYTVTKSWGNTSGRVYVSGSGQTWNLEFVAIPLDSESYHLYVRSNQSTSNPNLNVYVRVIGGSFADNELGNSETLPTNAGSVSYGAVSHRSTLAVGKSEAASGIALDVNGSIAASGNLTFSGADRVLGTTDAFQLSVRTNNTDRIRVLSTGQVGIGTSHTPSTSYQLDVLGKIYASDDIVAFSDGRYKTDVRTLSNALDKVSNMRGVTFAMIDDPMRRARVGLIAQEVEAVVPEAVTTDDTSGKKAVAYGNLVGVLVEAIKELSSHLSDERKVTKELSDQLSEANTAIKELDGRWSEANKATKELSDQLSEQRNTVKELTAQNERLEARLARLESMCTCPSN